MILITVQEDLIAKIDDPILTSAVEAVLLIANVEDSPSLSIRITDDQEIQTLNNQFRGFDKPTDVLSFEADFTDPDLESRYLGDVVISYPRAAAQADQRGHSADQELQLLVVHGILHLLGFDHAEPEEKERMWALQAQALERLGLDIQVEEE